jgi:large subunit ribosomal protein L23
MNPYDVLVRPLLSEKSNQGREVSNKYSFQVAVEKMFDVKVADVQTLVNRGKVRRRGNHVTKASNWKKAVVTLPAGAKIALFEDL